MLVLALLCLSGVVSVLLTIRQGFEFMDPNILWAKVAVGQMIFFSKIKFLAPVCGAGIAFAQFIPETNSKRLRLLMHLPVNHNVSLYYMMGVGFFCVFSLLLLTQAALLYTVSVFFPAEVVNGVLITTAPWFFSGIVAYFAIVQVIIEPVPWRKVLFAFAGFFVLKLYFFGRGYNTYEHSIWLYMLLGSLYCLTPGLSALRFKRGIV